MWNSIKIVGLVITRKTVTLHSLFEKQTKKKQFPLTVYPLCCTQRDQTPSAVHSAIFPARDEAMNPSEPARRSIVCLYQSDHPMFYITLYHMYFVQSAMFKSCRSSGFSEDTL